MIPNRKIPRLKNYDYSRPGFYFVTICANNRVCYFGDVKDSEMVLNDLGKIAERQWLWLKQNFPYVDLDIYQVMPNHFHGILKIVPVGNGLDRSLRKVLPLSNIVGAFKTTSSKLIHQSAFPDFSWQKSFYDHVIRDDADLDRIREYIRNNPKQWEMDDENPKNIPHRRGGF